MKQYTVKHLYFSLGLRDITGIPVNHGSKVPRYVSRYVFDHTGTLGKVRYFPEPSPGFLATFIFSFNLIILMIFS